MGRRLVGLAALALLAFGCSPSSTAQTPATPTSTANPGVENHASHGSANPNGKLAEPGSKMGG